MRPERHVSLVGLSGTGKSTVAPLLAGLLDAAWVDLDALVVDSAGVSVQDLFDNVGESGFRAHELEALRSAIKGPPCVIATGGGVVTNEESARLLEQGSTVVWLRASLDTLLSRLGAQDEPRPLLGTDPRASMAEMEAHRAPMYRDLQDLTVDVDLLDPAAVAAEIASLLEEQE